MEQGGGKRLGVDVPLRENAGDRERMRDVGLARLAELAFVRLLAHADRKLVGVAVLVVAAIGGGMVALQPVLQGLGNWNLLVFFVGVVGLLVFTGVPIAFAFVLATFGYLALTTQTPTLVVVGRMDEGMSHLILLAVPLFVFLGLLIEMTSMARARLGRRRMKPRSSSAVIRR